VLGLDKKRPKDDPRNHTLIAAGADVAGDISFTGTLHIQGTVRGNIVVQGESGSLVVAETGRVEGEIRVPRVVVNGRVEGDVHALEHLELASRAVVEGNVYYTVIEMLAGSQVDGRLIRQGEDGRRHLPAPEGSGEKMREATPGQEHT